MSWPIAKLGDHIQVLSGFAFNSKKFSNSEGVPLIRIRDVTRGFTETYYDGEFDDKYLINKGDLLVGMDGQFNAVRWGSGKALLNQRICKIEALGKLDERYLSHLLPNKLKEIEDKTAFVTVKHLSVKKIKEIEFPLPPIDEQKRIAAILDKADEIKKASNQTDELKNTLIRSTYLDMFGDSAITQKWEQKGLVEVVSQTNDIKCGPFGTQLSKQEYQSTGVPIWGIPQINSLFEKPPTEYISEEKADFLKTYSVLKDDIVMSRKGNVGRAAVFPEHLDEGILHSDALRIRVDDKIINPFFLCYQFKFNRSVISQIEQVSSGAIMAGINVGKLKSISVDVPPLNLQNKFSNILKSINNISTISDLAEVNSLSISQEIITKA